MIEINGDYMIENVLTSAMEKYAMEMGFDNQMKYRLMEASLAGIGQVVIKVNKQIFSILVFSHLNYGNWLFQGFQNCLSLRKRILASLITVKCPNNRSEKLLIRYDMNFVLRADFSETNRIKIMPILFFPCI